ncbi:hypothetical protein [Sinomonas atrocyanea]
MVIDMQRAFQRSGRSPCRSHTGRRSSTLHEQALALMQMLSPMCETTTVADLLA